jgi:hypothetical protein
MQRLNLPTYSFNIKSQDGGDQIFDTCRKKWVALTPEEWVRQHLLGYFVKELQYPVSLVATEMSIETHGLKRRCDIVVFNRKALPVLIAECKAPAVPLTQKVFDQVARYNYNLKVPYLLISNGLEHYCARIDSDTNEVKLLDQFPDYSTLDDQLLADN